MAFVIHPELHNLSRGTASEYHLISLYKKVLKAYQVQQMEYTGGYTNTQVNDICQATYLHCLYDYFLNSLHSLLCECLKELKKILLTWGALTWGR